MSRWILIGGAGLTGLKIAEDLIDRNIPHSKIIIADLKDSLEKVNINVKKVYCDISKNLLPRLDEDDIIKGIRLRPDLTHVVMTGRGASKKLIDSADLVTEMKLIHHPFKEQGIKAQEGIEY